MLPFPEIDPVAIHLGPLAIRWYGLAYVAGMLGGLWVSKRLAARFPALGITPDTIDALFTWVILGVVIGGRMGHMLFYTLPEFGPQLFLQDPLLPFRIWEGGMSFHGGVVGVAIALLVFAWRNNLHPADLADRITPVLPLGIFFGRLANFINGELWGRPADSTLPWAMVFPHVDALPRHPSQLYEAGLEGLLLGLLMWLTVRTGITRWQPTGVFLTGYALARIFVETFRTPDLPPETYVGFLQLTQGQLLSLPMLILGLAFLAFATRKN